LERQPDRDLVEDDDAQAVVSVLAHDTSVLAARWQASGAEQIDWREWDGEYVVYVFPQATTHLLGGTAGIVLRTLSATADALSTDEIGARGFGVSSAPDGGMPSVEEHSALQAILFDLERIGVVVRQTS
jgi:hypothetical protein